MRPAPSWLSASIFIVGLIGFIDATYLATNFFLKITPPCFATGGCDVVTTSQYATILGVPIALLGALYYLFVLALWLFYVDKKQKRVLTALPWITSSGFIFSLWLLGLQIFVLEALCSYCIISALTSTLLFVFALMARRISKEVAPIQTPPITQI